MKDNLTSVATRAVYAGDKPPASVTVPKVPPIYASSVFSFDSLDQIDEVYQGKAAGYVYSRLGNPGVQLLEEAMSNLESGCDAVAFASGMAAITCSVLALVSAGDHVVAAKVLYGGTYTFFMEDLPRRGVEVTLVDANDPDKVRLAMRENTKVVYCETISNPLMEVVDLQALAEIAHAGGSVLMVDNSFASPVLCRPLEHGADISMSSTTKYLNGHSDVMGGIAVFAPSDEARDDGIPAKVRSLGTLYGPVPSAFDTWLVLRGIRTVDLRVKKCSENALKLARFLAGHPKVKVVNYPGLDTSPSHSMALKYLSGGFGGMLSFDVKAGDLASARKVIDSLEMVELVPSLAGVGTTVSHPGKTSHRAIPIQERQAYGVGDGLIRVSVGIEDYGDIEEDFRRALERL